MGWTRVGLELSSAPRASLPVERRERVYSSTALDRTRGKWKVVSAGVRVASRGLRTRLGGRAPKLPEIQVVDYCNEAGERIRAIIDSWGPTRGATTVVIPPAWGKTKETLMPLAASLVSAFRAVGEPIVVIRFDGIRKRGESHNDPECNTRETDHHRFTFSQGVRDIQTTLDFLSGSPEFQPRRTVLVSFSASAIEARRATAIDRRIDGWITVVGAADVQSMMRVISGGIDYAFGIERNVRFGLQEILGIEVGMDHAAVDALEHSLLFLEDSRRDMASIEVPITWIHGRHDAWMDAERAKDVLSRGRTENRKFVEIPTGHILKTSTEALDTFRFIAREVGRIGLGREIEPKLPELSYLDLRRQAERGRLSEEAPDLQEFWRAYLLGGESESDLGIELMTSITPYRELMRLQVDSLALRPGDAIADLGSGTGAFPRFLEEWDDCPEGLRVYEVDFVKAALERIREGRGSRASASDRTPDLQLGFVRADLDVGRERSSIPLASGSVDAVLGGLFLSYVSDPGEALREMRRILRPGGRLVLSSLRRDADMSKLYADGLEELRTGRARTQFGTDVEREIDQVARGYLNQAARLMDLEERGLFRFWDPTEFEELVASHGFSGVSTTRSLGDPPQAVVLSAARCR